MQGKIKTTKLTAHDHYISIEWETEDNHGIYELTKRGTGWQGYSSIEDNDLAFFQEVLQACLLHIDFENE